MPSPTCNDIPREGESINEFLHRRRDDTLAEISPLLAVVREPDVIGAVAASACTLS